MVVARDPSPRSIVVLLWETAEEVDFAGGDSIDTETRRPQ
jgi:hypothetical protein